MRDPAFSIAVREITLMRTVNEFVRNRRASFAGRENNSASD